MLPRDWKSTLEHRTALSATIVRLFFSPSGKAIVENWRLVTRSRLFFTSQRICPGKSFVRVVLLCSVVTIWFLPDSECSLPRSISSVDRHEIFLSTFCACMTNFYILLAIGIQTLGHFGPRNLFPGKGSCSLLQKYPAEIHKWVTFMYGRAFKYQRTFIRISKLYAQVVPDLELPHEAKNVLMHLQYINTDCKAQKKLIFLK